jgi:hypothetical protein
LFFVHGLGSNRTKEHCLQTTHDRFTFFDHTRDDLAGDFLYFISQDDVLKIGRTKDVKSRLNGLQSGNPKRLTLVGAIPNNGFREAFWHACFAPWRRSGEWFSYTPDLKKAVEAALSGKFGKDTCPHLIPKMIQTNGFHTSATASKPTTKVCFFRNETQSCSSNFV